MPNHKEARARVKINRLLERAGWRFFDGQSGPANIQLEASVKITKKHIDAFGDDFESNEGGFVDFLLLDESGFPLVVLEAKREEKDPLDGKEQARRYAQSECCRFVILSNGNLHYFWDLERGNPEVISEFPTQESLASRREFVPDSKALVDETVGADYIALTQNPNYRDDPRYRDEAARGKYLYDEGLQILRPYQLKAVHALQKSVKAGGIRFLFEMATGTGKTLVSGAVIKLFLRTGNAKRVLFLVDRLELEEQARKNFTRHLKNDYVAVVYKHNRDDWKKAEIVISTVQSLASQDKYKWLFSPTDFDLVISDEAHRSIGGNSRAVFEYFTGYKLGLTATPKDYLKNIDSKGLVVRDPRAWERRQLLDTYTTFGCHSSEPTFRYTLPGGVKDGYLVNPIAVDARTGITTELLSKKGYAVLMQDGHGESVEQRYFHLDFEKKFFSEATNRVFCKAIIENALRDPVSGEIGKTIVFCISQKHASKIAQILNEMAHKIWPGKYNSDFAVQVTSNVQNAQGMTIDFANNNLNGRTQFLRGYQSGKTRICVTVGMMTTGYDCEDILNLALLRPVFSPTDFVQIKGRGTRKFTFAFQDENAEMQKAGKMAYKFFDFFANFEYFEEQFDYDEAIPIPSAQQGTGGPGATDLLRIADEIEVFDPDKIVKITETQIGAAGMKVDRKLFEKAKETIQKDGEVKRSVDQEQWEKAIRIVRRKYEDKPELYLNLERIRRSESLDRRLSWREFLERIFGRIDAFKSRDEKLDEEADKFISIHKPAGKYVMNVRNYLKEYVSDERFRAIINSGNFAELNVHPGFSMKEFRALDDWRDVVPEYVKDYIPLNIFME